MGGAAVEHHSQGSGTFRYFIVERGKREGSEGYGELEHLFVRQVGSIRRVVAYIYNLYKYSRQVQFRSGSASAGIAMYLCFQHLPNTVRYSW